MLKNFGELLDNIFRPLFEVSVNPDSHPDLHRFLAQVRVDLLLFFGVLEVPKNMFLGRAKVVGCTFINTCFA